MRKFLPAFIALVLPSIATAAEQPRRQNPDKAAPSGKVLPLKRSGSANACAEYGAGFVRIEGSNSCVKIGGATSIGGGISGGAR